MLGKHTKRILCGAWSGQRLLALVGEDRLLSVSNEEGDTLAQTLLKGEPSQLRFGRLTRADAPPDGCVSLVLNRRQLLLLAVQQPLDQPVALAFQERYGEIVAYEWLGVGGQPVGAAPPADAGAQEPAQPRAAPSTQPQQLLVAFSGGYLVLLSTAADQLGQELTYVKLFKEGLSLMALSRASGKIALCSENT